MPEGSQHKVLEVKYASSRAAWVPINSELWTENQYLYLIAEDPSFLYLFRYDMSTNTKVYAKKFYPGGGNMELSSFKWGSLSYMAGKAAEVTKVYGFLMVLDYTNGNLQAHF